MAASAETGELFVVPGHFGGMRVLNQDGNGKKNRSFNGLGFPSAVAVDDQNDEVCVVDGQNILCYDRAASGAQKPKRKIVTELPLTDIAIDPASNSIYVLSKEKNQMLIYNRTAQGKAFPVQKIDLNDDTFGGSLLRRVDVASGLALLP
jgi:DNA-binding beta-propeller fold protein YncE